MIVKYNDPANDTDADQKADIMNFDMVDSMVNVLVLVGTGLAVKALANPVGRMARAVKGRGGHVLWINPCPAPRTGILAESITDEWSGDCQEVAVCYLRKHT